MKIEDPGPETLRAAVSGHLPALDRLLLACQPGVYNLAVRVLGNREDAADATWAWRVAHNHLLTARTRSLESPMVSLDAMAERLGQGLDFATASEYVPDTMFDLPSAHAAEVVGISPAAYRQRLSRTRARWHAFMATTCGLVHPQAACRCERQLPAARHVAAAGRRTIPVLAAQRAQELREAEQNFSAFTRVSDAAAVFRAHPAYQAPGAMIPAIRAVLTQEGFMQRERLQ